MAKKIELSKGMFAIVDDDDYESLSKYNWYVTFVRGTPKAVRRRSAREKGSSSVVYMHRQVMSVSHKNNKTRDSMQVDHINRNTLDNRKENLRIVTASQNSQNRGKKRSHRGMKPTSKYIGVCLSGNKKWRSEIRYKKYKKSLGIYVNESDAAYAYNIAARRLFGEYAATNKIPLGDISSKRMREISKDVERKIDDFLRDRRFANGNGSGNSK